MAAFLVRVYTSAVIFALLRGRGDIPLPFDLSFWKSLEYDRLPAGQMLRFGRPVRPGADELLQYNRAAVPADYINSSAEDIAHYLIAPFNGGRYVGAVVLDVAITTICANDFRKC